MIALCWRQVRHTRIDGTVRFWVDAGRAARFRGVVLAAGFRRDPLPLFPFSCPLGVGRSIRLYLLAEHECLSRSTRLESYKFLLGRARRRFCNHCCDLRRGVVNRNFHRVPQRV
jgi:hypothetical protein